MFTLSIRNADDKNENFAEFVFRDKTDLHCTNKYFTEKHECERAGIENNDYECKLYQTGIFCAPWWVSFTCLSLANIMITKVCCCLQNATNIWGATKTGNHHGNACLFLLNLKNAVLPGKILNYNFGIST